MKKVLFFAVFTFLLAANVEAGMRCRGGFVHVDYSKAEVLQKCGHPLHVEGTIISSDQVWTYIEGGFYRFLYFRGHKLERIEDGNLVR